MNKLLAAVLAASVSTSVFAWPGNGQRPPHEPRIPVDTPGSQKVPTDSEDRILVKVRWTNGTQTPHLCDIMGQITVRKGNFQEADIFHVTERRQVEGSGGFNERYTFDKVHFGDGYRFVKASQKYKAACLPIPEGSDVDDAPSPHTRCDPEFEDCGWTCQSHQQQSDRCANSDQNWSDDSGYVDQDW